MNDEDMIVWQDILDLILAGRGDGLQCPFCKKAELHVSQTARGNTRVMCSNTECRKFIEGQLQDP